MSIVPRVEAILQSAQAETGSPAVALPAPTPERFILAEQDFRRVIAVERKRTERSKKSFLLVLLDFGGRIPADNHVGTLRKAIRGLASSTRETDLAGWYRQDAAVGVLFTGLDIDHRNDLLGIMLARVSDSLREHLAFEQFNKINIALHVFPEKWEQDEQRFPGNSVLYPDLAERRERNRWYNLAKRLLDVTGSIVGLIVFAPLVAAIAFLVKVSSKGPVFFRQDRLGEFGEPFQFLKFRTMYENNDVKIHREFIKHVIKGEYTGATEDDGKAVYKMTKDPRVTRIGEFLRRTSLDELPQFINVLRGDMSLVGPRPPLAYEYLEYDLWHRRRVVEVKPGLTGLWQVKGRSRIGFNDMVRLDLQYSRQWSPWLDIQILARTPGAVLFGNDSF